MAEQPQGTFLSQQEGHGEKGLDEGNTLQPLVLKTQPAPLEPKAPLDTPISCTITLPPLPTAQVLSKGHSELPSSSSSSKVSLSGNKGGKFILSYL